jgi:hypothetical protein
MAAKLILFFVNGLVLAFDEAFVLLALAVCSSIFIIILLAHCSQLLLHTGYN